MNLERLAVILVAAIFGPPAAFIVIAGLLLWAALKGELEIY